MTYISDLKIVRKALKKVNERKTEKEMSSIKNSLFIKREKNDIFKTRNYSNYLKVENVTNLEIDNFLRNGFELTVLKLSIKNILYSDDTKKKFKLFAVDVRNGEVDFYLESV